MKIGYLMQAGVPDIRKYPLSGPANHVKNTFKALRELGHEIRLLAFLENRIWESSDLESFAPVAVPSFDRVPVRWIERAVRRVQHDLRLPYAALFESLRFAQACIRELAGFDILYERHGWFGYGAGIASRRLGIPLLLEVNGDLLRELEIKGMPPGGIQRLIALRLMRLAAHVPVRVVATGEGWRQKFVKQWQIPADRTVVVENGTELVHLLSRDRLRAFQPAPRAGEPVTLAFVGSFEPWQGLPVMLRASARAIEHGLPVRLLIIGAGREKAAIAGLIADLGIQTFVTFPGHLPPPDLAFFLAQADIGISPYFGRVEYSGLKLLDYKAAGLAVIASGENGQPSLIHHGHTGWIVPPGDENALFGSICRLVQDEFLRREMGRRARCEAEELHSWKHTAERLEALFLSATREARKVMQTKTPK